jgi:hypothetical protein
VGENKNGTEPGVSFSPILLPSSLPGFPNMKLLRHSNWGGAF